MDRFNNLATANPANLRSGVRPGPLVTRRGLRLEGGMVYPELNFPLPPVLGAVAATRFLPAEYDF
jgi:methanol--5-hydroxybenzimidazolylcobamide Co-methyltransferase